MRGTSKSACPRLLLLSAILLLCLPLLFACSDSVSQELPVVSDYLFDPIVEINDLRVGVVSGPYWDMFEEAILPSLEEKGYTATMVYYTDYESPNFALAENEIDLNIFQHYEYLNTFKFENDLALSAIMDIPTVSMSIFSEHYNSIDQFENGITASIPDDASNLARALRVLEAANIITLDPAIDKTKATIGDITSNPKNIQLVPISAHHLVETRAEYRISVIPGNFAISSGLDLSKALYTEVLTEYYKIVVVVRTEDLNKQFVRDIIEVIHSDRFRETISDPAGSYLNFQWPRWLHDMMG